ncbi:hypothetical protein C806_04143 [Lachnospiraceae bacterium 3-1]|nr:hypothetical protein C806_04143 [Lachnospiraceae bacterium 3-1]
MIQLSKRLQSVADLVENCETMADVGTDHGYIPVYLVFNQKVNKAIAMDVNPGPLKRAKEHIFQYGFQKSIETRLSDGCFALEPGEADVIVIAGMGGALMQRIMEEGEAVAQTAQRLVLQPQSEIGSFRRFLFAHGYGIVAEDMVLEDGKYYPIIAAQYMGWEVNATERSSGRENQDCFHDDFRIACKFGPLLLSQHHPALRTYLVRQQKQKQKILENLKENARQDVVERVQELSLELRDIETALKIVEPERRQSYDLS